MSGEKLISTKIVSDNVISEINRLKQAPGKDIIIFGSPSVSHMLIRETLIDDSWLFINPILLGEGIPFKDIKKERNYNPQKPILFLPG